MTTTWSLRASCVTAMISIPLERHSIRWSRISLATFSFSAREWLMTTNSTSVGDGIAAATKASRSGSCRVTTTATRAPAASAAYAPEKTSGQRAATVGSTASKALVCGVESVPNHRVVSRAGGADGTRSTAAAPRCR